MDARWIVSANASRARFFSQANLTAPLQEINDMVNEASRLRTSETERDRLGITAAAKSAHNVGAATPSSGYEPAVTPDRQEAESFARSVADYLLQGQQEGRYKQITLIASPQFLGALRKCLDPKVGSAVNVEINKDYTHCNAAQLREQIQAHRDKTWT